MAGPAAQAAAADRQIEKTIARVMIMPPSANGFVDMSSMPAGFGFKDQRDAPIAVGKPF